MTTLVSFVSEDADSVSWTFEGENGEESYQLEKQDGIWVWPQDTGLQLDQDAVRSLLQTVENISAEKVFTAGEDSDLSDYGMDNPSCSVTVAFRERANVSLSRFWSAITTVWRMAITSWWKVTAGSV